MSNTDSFIDEVTEEVRKEKLYQTFRRYGWIGALALVAIVGGAGLNEWRKAAVQAEAEALGDAYLAALTVEDPAARAAAVAALPAEGPASVLRELMLGDPAGGDASAAVAALLALSADPAAPPVYRDLALVRAVMLQAAEGLAPPADRIAMLQPLTLPGGPYRLIALELTGLAQIESADLPAARATLQSVVDDAETGSGQRQRIQDLLTALGGAA